MKLAAIGSLVLGALPLLIYPFVLLANVMSFAGTPTGQETNGQWLVSRAFLFGTTLYPIIYLVFAVIGIVNLVRKKSRAALNTSLVPLIYLAFLAVVFAVWAMPGLFNPQDDLFAQGQGGVSLIGECTPPVFDGGDAYKTTGCGVIENGSAAGRIESSLEAHNWQFTAQNSSQVNITSKNDGKSCPQIILLDANGQVVEDFDDENRMHFCPEGMISTSFFAFKTPVANQIYIIRLFTPESPGAYRLEIK